MAGDRARISFAAGRKYREMVSQQGRVSLEADQNEGQRIFSEEVRHHALDFVGPCGTPDDGYKITAPPADFQIGPGTMYTGGVRTTLEQKVSYSTQKDWLDTAQPQPWADDLWRPVNQLNQGNSHAMLVLTEREVTSTEDPALRDVALGGPDTAARIRILQRVVAAPSDGSTCSSAAAGMASFWSAHGLLYDPATAALRPRARLQVSMVQSAPPPSPCDPPAASGYLGADNQLIRVQMVAFDPNTRKGKLLWAYHNGSTLYRVKALDATTLELASRPVSAEFEPRSGQIAQVLLSAAEIEPPTPNIFPEGAYVAALTGHRASLNAPYAAETRRVALPAALPGVLTASAAPLFLRLWEEELDFDLGNPVALTGTGLRVAISQVNAGMLHIGDSWSFAVRPLTPNAVYPERYLQTPQPPDSARMWVCSLAALRAIPSATGAAGGSVQVDDCRVPFDPLTTPGGVDKDCCCIKVTPKDAERLQEIVDQAVAGADGAAVSLHLQAGVYRLRRPLILNRRHRGVVLQGCSGSKPVLQGGEDPRFAHGLILALQTADVTIRGLEFRLAPAKLPDEFLKIMKQTAATAASTPFSPPRQIAIGIRVVQTLSISVEDCDFRLPAQEATFSAGILIQGDNGSVTARNCRFDGAGGTSVGVLLAPSPVVENRDGLLRYASTEVLRITGCIFARLSAGMLLAGGAALTYLESNATSYVYFSLITFWFDQKLRVLNQLLGAMDPKSNSKLVQKFVHDSKQDPVLNDLLLVSFLIPLEKLEGEVSGKREEIYTLVDLAAETAAQNKMTEPRALRMTIAGNHFDARLPRIPGGFDTLIWDLTSTSAEVSLRGNTHWNRSGLPTVVLLRCEGLNITGNVIGNETRPNDDLRVPALVVLPELANPAMKPAIYPFTATGNTMFGLTNLADFPREEWANRLPGGAGGAGGAGGLLSWEFFNSIS